MIWLIKILKALGTLLCVLLALLLCALIFPRRFWVEYTCREGLTVKMNLLLFKVKIFPLPRLLLSVIEKKADEKTEKPKKPKAEGREKPKKQKPSPLENIEFSFDLVKQILSAAKGIMKRVIRAFKFSDISFTIPLHAADAFETQKLYGNVSVAFYSFNTFLQRYVRVYYKKPLFVADFADNYKDSTYFYMKITASPILLTAAGIFAFKQYRLITKNNQKAQAEEKEI